MDYLTTRGLVLRTTEYKETDRILTVLSADHGLLTMKARGVRSNRSKLKGACQLLTYADIFAFNGFFAHLSHAHIAAAHRPEHGYHA